MEKEPLAWVKTGSCFLAYGQLAMSPALWLAAKRCAELAEKEGLPSEAALLLQASEAMELAVEPRGAWIDLKGVEAALRMGYGDPLARWIYDKAAQEMSCASAPGRYQTEIGTRCARILKSLPKTWTSGLWTVSYAKRSNAVIKQKSSSLPASQALDLVRASTDLARVAALVALIAEPVKALKKIAKKRKWDALDGAALDLADNLVKRMGKSCGFLGERASVEFIDESTRFAPQKAYAAFLPEGAQPEGFWGSTNQGGMDLGSAKLFESPERARSYFKQAQFGQYAIVELEIKIKSVLETTGSMVADGLQEAIAGREKSDIMEALAHAEIEDLRSMLDALALKSGEPEEAVATKKPHRL